MPGRRRIRLPCSAASPTSGRARSTHRGPGDDSLPVSRAPVRVRRAALGPVDGSLELAGRVGLSRREPGLRAPFGCAASRRAAPPRPASAERGGHRHDRVPAGTRRGPRRRPISGAQGNDDERGETSRGEGRRPPVVATRWDARFRAPSVSLPRCADDLPVSAITRRPLLPHGVNSRGRKRTGHQLALRTTLRERRSPLRRNPQRGEATASWRPT